MLKRRGIVAIALLAMLAAFGWGIAELFKLRFASGDIYPEYSSLRADPLGTKAYFEALHALGGTVQRHLASAHQLPHGPGTTAFYFALPHDELERTANEFRALEAFVRNGGRLVVTLFPEFSPVRRWPGPAVTNSAAAQRAAGQTVDLQQKWGFGTAYSDIKRGPDGTFPSLEARPLTQDLPGVSWHSGLVFTNVGLEWKVIYARDTDPVMIERRLGSGTIVFATDSYFASNEALQNEREARLLAWLAGQNHTIVFDEAHLGVREQPGIAAMARRYNLHGAVAALLVLALLFVWKNSASFVPRLDENGGAVEVRGRDAAAGFTNLLRRSIKPEQLLQACLNEWHKARLLDRRASPRKMEKVTATVENFNAGPERNSVATYNEISRILNEK